MKKTILLIAFLGVTLSSNAQWTQPTSTTLNTTNNVTIGTLNNPGYNFFLGNTNTFKMGISGNDNTFTGAEISIARTNTAAGLGHGPSIQLNDNSNNYAVMLQSYAGNFQIFNYTGAWTESMRVASNGYVGIGTIAPGSTLSLGSSTQHNKLSLFESGNYRWGFGITSQQFEEYMANDNTANHISWGSMSTDGNQTFTELMRLRLNGQVVIGASNFATSPTYQSGVNKLSVGGGIESDAITVKTQGTWPDYVFNPEYKLESLNDIKKFIIENHHLPEMPSEAEITKNGQNLGEMNKLLVKKVEELTLYLIEKAKKENQQQLTNKTLTEKLANQDKQLKTQELRLETLEKQITSLTAKH